MKNYFYLRGDKMKKENWLIKILGLWLVVLYSLAILSSISNAEDKMSAKEINDKNFGLPDYYFSEKGRKAYEIMKLSMFGGLNQNHYDICTSNLFKAMIEGNEMNIAELPQEAREVMLQSMCFGMLLGYIYSFER